MKSIVLARSSRGEQWRLLGWYGLQGFVLSLLLLASTPAWDDVEAVIGIYLILQLLVVAVWLMDWVFWRWTPAYRTEYVIEGTNLLVKVGERIRRLYDLREFDDVYVRGDTDWDHGFYFIGLRWKRFPSVYLHRDNTIMDKSAKPIFVWGRNAIADLDARVQEAHAQIRAGNETVDLAPWVYRDTSSRIDRIVRFGWWMFWLQWAVVLAIFIWI